MRCFGIGRRNFFEVGCLGICLLVSSISYGQSEIYQWHDSIVGIQNTPILTGKQYLVKTPAVDQHPFLEQKNPWSGAAIIDNQTYNRLKLLYDIYNDLLVIEFDQNGKPIWIEMSYDRVESFQLEERKFTKALFQTRPTYMEVLASSEARRLLAKRRKIKNNNNGVITLDPDPLYFIANGSDLMPLRGRGQFYSLFPDRKSDIKEFLRKNKVDTRKESGMIALFNYCEANLN